MAHFIQIPFSFEFRIIKASWTQMPVSVSGWAKLSDGNVDRDHLTAKLGTPLKTRAILLPVGYFSKVQRQAIAATLKGKLADEAVASLCAQFDLRAFVPSHQLSVVVGKLKADSQPADAWLLRDEFLGLDTGSTEVEAFLNRWGRWNATRAFVSNVEMSSLQRAVRDALVSSSAGWFAGRNPLPVTPRAVSTEFPYFGMLTDACEEAIRLTTTIDLLGKLEFRTCERLDCAKPFEIKSKHKRSYCSQYCAHLESVRRSRRPKKSDARSVILTNTTLDKLH